MPEADLDALLEGEGSTTGDSQNPQQSNGNQPAAAEEAQEFNKLTGSTQDRIKKLVQRAKSAEADAERAKALAYQGVNKLPPPPPAYSNPDVQNAVKQLENVGVATKDYVKSEVQQLLAQMQWEDKIKRLSEAENGDNGRPRFDRYEYEDFVRQNPQYRYYEPEHVFGIMYRDELLNWEMQQASQGRNQSSPLKNTKTFSGSDDLWDAQYIEDKLGSFTDPREKMNWYEKNRDKIEKVLNQ